MPNTRYRHFVAGLLLLLCFSAYSAQAISATEFKIITLQHRFVEDILPMIHPLVGSDGVVTGMQNQLIIRASAEKMSEIEQLIAHFDVARQNLKITVSRQNNHQAERNGFAMNGRKRIGHVEIGTRSYPKNSADGVQLNIENNQQNSHASSQQFVNVIDGEHAFIRVGQSVPFTQEWLTLTRRYLRIQKTTEFVDISTGFSVRPRTIGDQIELEITPRIAQLNQSGFIDFEELTTIVRVNKGEWLDLGGIMQQKDEVSRAILSQQTQSQSQENQLSIRVE